MPILKALTVRRAYRALKTDPIPSEVLLRLVEAAHLAPSSGNNQPWRIITVVDETILEELKTTLSRGNYWGQNAPAIAAFVTNEKWSLVMGDRKYAPFELGMAAMAYQMQAFAEGLYAHPIAGFNAEAAKEILGIDTTNILETLIILGYPGDVALLNEKHQELEQSVRVRKPLEEIAAFNKWNTKLDPA
jgi:nitroreductase